MPVTITESRMLYTGYATQRKVFHNPRGLKYFYALACDSATNDMTVFKSETGDTWSLVVAVFLGAQWADITFYEDDTNNRTVVYFVFGNGADEIHFRRGVIPDNSSDITLDAEQRIPREAPDRAVIQIADDGYVWIVYEFRYTAKGMTWSDVNAFASTTPYPSGTPTWSDDVTVHPALTDYWHVSPTIAPLSAVHDVLITWHYHDGTNPRVGGREFSWDGTDFISGVSDNFIVTVNPYITLPEFPSSVVDSGNAGHCIYFYSDTSLRHRKWVVGSGFDTETTIVNTTTDLETCGLSIDMTSSPEVLFAFYIYQYGIINYKTSPVDTISWSDEESIADNTDEIDYLSVSYRDWNNDSKVQILYTRQVSPYYVRYEEVTLVVPIPPPKYSFTIPLRYIKMTLLIKRNGEIIGYRTSYTPYRTERPIQPETE